MRLNKFGLDDVQASMLRSLRNQDPELADKLMALQLGWYKITNKADDDEAEVLIYDTIGGWFFGVNATDFVHELRDITASKINVRINSPGGRVFDGIAIYNALVRHPADIHVHVDGLAASIASIIAMAGDRVTMMQGSQMMIHDALGIEIGNAKEHRAFADFLDRQSENLSHIYAERTGKTAAELREMMLAETWMFANEAVELGFADDVHTRNRKKEDDEEDSTEDTDVKASNEAVIAEFEELMKRNHMVNGLGFKYAGRKKAPAPIENKIDRKSEVVSLIDAFANR